MTKVESHFVYQCALVSLSYCDGDVIANVKLPTEVKIKFWRLQDRSDARRLPVNVLFTHDLFLIMCSTYYFKTHFSFEKQQWGRFISDNNFTTVFGFSEEHDAVFCG